jgi:hypothetical protein
MTNFNIKLVWLVLLVHNSHVNFQPFVKRREWFYQNISDDYNPDEILHIPANDQDVLVINRGIKYLSTVKYN